MFQDIQVLPKGCSCPASCGGVAESPLLRGGALSDGRPLYWEQKVEVFVDTLATRHKVVSCTHDLFDNSMEENRFLGFLFGSLCWVPVWFSGGGLKLRWYGLSSRRLGLGWAWVRMMREGLWEGPLRLRGCFFVELGRGQRGAGGVDFQFGWCGGLLGG